jgi:hypothetical protein
LKVPTQTARFTNVIEQSGKPKAITLWGKPDASFRAAIQQTRIMTIRIHPVGNKAEFGLVGFHQEKSVLYLVFPRSLAQVKDRRIVGVNLDLVEEEGVSGKPALRTRDKSKIQRPLAPAEKKFRITIRSTAIVDTVHNIKARNRAAAEKQAQVGAKQYTVDFSNAKVERSVLSVVPDAS